jgi:uroporphyrinogen III methyltransferase / synthase
MCPMAAGRVYLVGAGPGDPGLLTLRGRQCLAAADLVLYDGLVNPLLLRHTQAAAERTCRVAGPDGMRLDQQAINERLIDAARQGLTVVRLKGGDPYIFGRGSEEAAALAQAGITYEVVPGVTAATATGAYAGFSLTHRDHASAVAFITGHEDPAKPETTIDYEALVRFPGTLVFYMGLDRLPAISAALVAAGMPGSTPAAVVSRATTPRQRTVAGTLEHLPGQVAAAALRPPSLIIIGECVRLRETINWFEQRPLFGLRIGITRPDHQADSEIQRCLELGAEPVLMPTIAIEPVTDTSEIDATLERLDAFDWLVVTSVNGVQHLLDRLWQTGGDVRRLAHLKLAAIGTSTAAALEKYSLRADLVPEQFRAEALAEALAPQVAGKRVLWARASRGRDVLPDMLTAAGATVEELVVYRNEDVTSYPENVTSMLDAGEIDWIGLSSPSIARHLATLLSDTARTHLGSRSRLAAISPVTAAAATEAGLPVAVVAEEYTWEGIFAAIQRAYT